MSSADFIEQHSECPYSAGDTVLLLQPDRRQKRLAPYEIGWTVVTVVSKSTVVVSKPGRSNKVVNIALLKPDPSVVVTDVARQQDFPEQLEPPQKAEVDHGDDVGYLLEFDDGVEPPAPRYGLRNRADLQQPARYRE